MVQNDGQKWVRVNSRCRGKSRRQPSGQADGELGSEMSESEDKSIKCLYFEYGRENRMRGEQSRALELIVRINRKLVLLFGAYLLNVDLEARLEDQDERRRRGRALEWAHLKRSTWRRQLKLGWISQAITGLFLILVGHVLAVTYYQYSFDFELIKSRSYVTRGARAQPQEANLTASMSWAKQQLDRLASSAFMHQTMIIECVYVSLAIFALLIYLTPLICHYFLVPFDFDIVRELLDPERELSNSRRSTERAVADFMESSRLFVMHRRNSNQADGDKLPVSQKRALAAMSHHEAKLGKLLNDMLDRSALKALNKRPNSIWPLARSSVHLLCHLSIFTYSILFDFMIIWGSFVWPNSGSGGERLRLTQSLVMFSCIGLLIINLPSVGLFAPVYFVATIDQIWFVNQLIKLIQKCIESNQLAFDEESNTNPPIGSRMESQPARKYTKHPKASAIVTLQQQRQPPLTKAPTIPRDIPRMSPDRARAMNSNLIFALLHYRIFVDQYEPVRVALTAAVSGAIVLMFLMPIIIRIHLDYIMQIHVSLASTSAVRWSAVALSSSVLLPGNFVIIPLCHLNSRCRKLYKTLISLMAHLIRVRAHPMGAKLYDQHSVTMLRKELSHPDFMINRFVIRSLLLNGTYGTLTRAHFWWSFLVISILVDYEIGERQDSLIISLMSDPFGLHN